MIIRFYGRVKCPVHGHNGNSISPQRFQCHGLLCIPAVTLAAKFEIRTVTPGHTPLVVLLVTGGTENEQGLQIEWYR